MVNPKDNKTPKENLFQRAFALHQSGNFLEAKKLYKKILKKDPNNAEIFHLLGILAGQQHHYKEARRWETDALKLLPDSATLHNSLGNIERRLGNNEQAI